MHCDDMDAVSTWNKPRLLFCTEGHGSVAALRRQFNSMQYEMGMPMRDWVTKVEDLARRLDDIHFPMIPIDIINTLTRNLPDPYSPFIVLVNSLLDDPNYSANSSTVQEVIKRLLNEEAHQTKATYVDFPSAHIARDCRKPVTCYNCGESGHLRFDCELSPREVRIRREQRSHGSKQSDDEARAAYDASDSEMVPPVVY